MGLAALLILPLVGVALADLGIRSGAMPKVWGGNFFRIRYARRRDKELADEAAKARAREGRLVAEGRLGEAPGAYPRIAAARGVFRCAGRGHGGLRIRNDEPVQ